MEIFRIRVTPLKQPRKVTALNNPAGAIAAGHVPYHFLQLPADN